LFCVFKYFSHHSLQLVALQARLSSATQTTTFLQSFIFFSNYNFAETAFHTVESSSKVGGKLSQNVGENVQISGVLAQHIGEEAKVAVGGGQIIRSKTLYSLLQFVVSSNYSKCK